MALPAWFDQVAAEVRNWGRWGPDDELGTLNLVTPEVVRRAAASVRTGRRFSLSLPLSESQGVQAGYIPGRINPVRTMTQINTLYSADPDGFAVNDDLVVMGLQAGTHWDGLAHVSYRGRIWNGYPATTVTAAGASRCGVQGLDSLVSRGVLLDVARVHGVPRLEPGHPVTDTDLDRAEEQAGVPVEPGDIVLVRTGHVQLVRERRPDRDAYGHPSPGLTVASARWLRRRDVAAVATDNLTFEVFPCEDPEVLFPVHLLHLVEMGLTQGQNWQLEELAADCAGDGVYAFLLSAPALPFTGGAGAPVSPVAVK